jgi:hypothetical protein
MNRDRRSSSNDPSDEPVASQSSQSASGLSGGRPGPGVEFNAEDAEDVVNRAGADTATPRRYEQPVDDDSDPVMPSGDATLNTKI